MKNPDPFNGIWGGQYCRPSPVQSDRKCDCFDGTCKATDKYMEELRDVFNYSVPKGRCAGMIAESIQGVGGVVQFTKGYIKKAADLVHENNGLFISDEVQTGFGRTGDHFWGFQNHDIIPDIVTMAKGIGNGFPLGAVVTTPKIAESLSRAAHFNTYGGNPLACTAGLAVLEVIEKEGLQQNSKEVGTYFLNSLNQLRNLYDVIGDVRGQVCEHWIRFVFVTAAIFLFLITYLILQGLMIGLEFVESKEGKLPLAKDKFQRIFNRTKDYGVLFGGGGFYGNIMRITPPMCFTKKNVDYAIDVLDKSIQDAKL